MENLLSPRWDRLPGCDLIAQGLADITAHLETTSSELVKIGSPRLRACGIAVDVAPADALDADRRLYRLLASVHGDAAHSQYNALLRQLVSFERAVERELSRADRTPASA